jgi:transcriptional regulator with XRE-family HTH domain
MSNGGKKLRELINQRRFTIEEVATAIGVTSRTMRNWTTTAPIDKLYAIAEYIDVPFIQVAEFFRPDRSEQASDAIDQN